MTAISAITRMSTTQKNLLNNGSVASQKCGGLGARIDYMQYAADLTPAVGTLTPIRAMEYEVAPALQTAVYVHAAIPMTSGAQTITTLITNPDVPRIVTIKGNASGNAGNVVINGTDINGNVIANTIALNGSSEVIGTKAFKTVTSIVLPAEVHAGTDTTSIGIGVKLGLPHIMKYALYGTVALFDGANDAGGAFTVGATVDICLYQVAGTMDGAKKVSLIYLA